MADNNYVYKNDLPLYIDVHCYECRRLVALSNTTEHDGRKYCGRCSGQYRNGDAVSAFVSDFGPVWVVEID